MSSNAGREDANVPTDVRRLVIERDASCCRICGRYVEHPALHHIEYRSEGGTNEPWNLVVLGWLPGHDCHLPVAHANKRLWQPILMHIATRPGVTGLSVLRAYRAALRRGVADLGALQGGPPYRV